MKELTRIRQGLVNYWLFEVLNKETGRWDLESMNTTREDAEAARDDWIKLEERNARYMAALIA